MSAKGNSKKSEDDWKHRVLVIVNKDWECAPVVGVLLNDEARPEELRDVPVDKPAQSDHTQAPRLIFTFNDVRAEIWCISDLLSHLKRTADFQSSTEWKSKNIGVIFEGQEPSLVIAVGTAGYPNQHTENGSVVIGSRVFIHNAHPNGDNPASNWTQGPFDTMLDSSLTETLFNELTVIETSPKMEVLDRFLAPPLNPVSRGDLIARHDFVSLGVVNVTDYSEYGVVDEETIAAFVSANNISLARSLETTHGLIRVQSDAPFLFISGIVDRVGHFAEEVQPRSYAQNFVGAHNAGIAVAWMLPRIIKALTK